MIASTTTWETEADVYTGRQPQPEWRLGQGGQWRLGKHGQLEFLPAIVSALPFVSKIFGKKKRRRVVAVPPKPAIPIYVWVGGGVLALGMMGLLALTVLKK